MSKYFTHIDPYNYYEHKIMYTMELHKRRTFTISIVILRYMYEFKYFKMSNLNDVYESACH